MLDISAHVAVDVGVVLVGDLGVVEPLDVVEEGEELSVGDRIEREQTFFSVYFLSSVHLHGSAAAATDRAGNSALHTSSLNKLAVTISASIRLRPSVKSLVISQGP